jgi:hypothetical protein
MRLPLVKTQADFVKLYNFMNGAEISNENHNSSKIYVGSSSDNFYQETYSGEKGTEMWCGVDAAVPAEISADSFRLLHERSILYSKKGYLPKNKLVAVRTTLLDSSVRVNHFFCEPEEE